MKQNFYSKITLAVMLSSTFTFASAKDVFLSTTGVDTNDGLTVTTPVASFSKAYTIAVASDIIKVTGMIDMSMDPGNSAYPQAGIVVNKDITIQGTSNSTDGFDGKSITRLFQVGGHTLTVKNLTLKNGKYSVTGSNGGAFFIFAGAVNGENLVLDSNAAFDTSSPGGAIMVTGTTGLSFKNCSFTNNSAMRGGALCIQDTGTPNVIITINGCSFISNSTTNGGGAGLFVRLGDGATNNIINLINSTVTKNSVTVAQDGGAVGFFRAPSVVGDKSTFNIINCTITGNTTAGTRGHGAGVRAVPNSTYPGQMRINNSIIEGNIAIGQGSTYSDLSYIFNPTASSLLINNSIIGRTGDGVFPIECYPGFAATPVTNYFNSNPTVLIAKLGTYNSTYKCYPLQNTSPASPAIDFGDSQYLTALTITTDQLGNTRSFTNSKCYAGAVEILESNLPTSISKVTTEKNFIAYYSTESLIVESFLSGQTQIDLYTITGQKIQSLLDSKVETRKRYVFPISILNKGIYIVKVVVDGKSSAQKVCVK